jgi:hypothetical protein
MLAKEGVSLTKGFRVPFGPYLVPGERGCLPVPDVRPVNDDLPRVRYLDDGRGADVFDLWDPEFAPQRGVAENLTRTRLVIKAAPYDPA